MSRRNRTDDLRSAVQCDDLQLIIINNTVINSIIQENVGNPFTIHRFRKHKNDLIIYSIYAGAAEEIEATIVRLGSSVPLYSDPSRIKECIERAQYYRSLGKLVGNNYQEDNYYKDELTRHGDSEKLYSTPSRCTW